MRNNSAPFRKVGRVDWLVGGREDRIRAVAQQRDAGWVAIPELPWVDILNQHRSGRCAVGLLQFSAMRRIVGEGSLRHAGRQELRAW